MRWIALFSVALGVGCSAAQGPAAAPVVIIAPVEAPPPPAESAEPAPVESVARAAPKPVAKPAPVDAAALQAELDNLDRAMVLAALSAQGSSVSLGSVGGGAPSSQGGVGSVAGIGAAGPAPAAPVGRATIGPPDLKGGAVVNAQAVVAGMRAGFRRCYNRALQSDPAMKGKLSLTAIIGPSGEVMSVSVSRDKGIGGDVISCVTARVRNAQFAPPTSGSATLTIPIDFDFAP
jgi:hypothetical protein